MPSETDDIEQLKQHIVSLEKELSLYRQIIGSAPVSIFAKNLDKEHILSNTTNNINLRMYESQIIGKTNDEIFPPEIAQALNTLDDRILAGESKIVHEGTLDSGSLKKHFIATRVPFFDENGKIAGIFGISQDITLWKNYQLNTQQEYQQLLMNNFTMGLTHDLNNFLTTIISNIDLLMFDELTIAQRNILVDINKAGQLASQLIFDIKNPGKLPEHLGNRMLLVQFGDILQETNRLIGLTNYEQIKYTQTIEVDSARIVIDSRHLIQILMNIELNAIEAMMGKGEINIIVHQEVISGIQNSIHLKDGNYVIISINDTGPGITNNILLNLFNPYYTTKPHGNSGLGLYISKNIINEYGGEIIVETEIGKGTSFIVYLPIVDAK